MPRNNTLSYVVDRQTGLWKALSGCSASSEMIPGSQMYGANRFTDDELPTQVDLRSYMTPVENQAGANSCTANAVVGGYEYIMNRVGYEIDFSRLFIYYNARLLGLHYFGGEKIVDQGSSITLALMILQEKGVCSEDVWPYQILDNGKVERINDEPHEEAYNEAQEFLNQSKFRWESPEKISIDLHSMKHCLAEGYPFVFGLVLFQSFDQVKSKGRVPMPDLKGEAGRQAHGKHAMLCVGYKDSAKVFIVRNSWGESWGDGGYCYIPYEYMTNPELCFDAWKIKGTTEVDLTEDISADEDEDYDEDEDEDEDYDEDEDEDEEEEPDVCYLTLIEAIAILALYGAKCDGMSKKEAKLLKKLYRDYEIDADDLDEKIDTLLEVGGFEVLYQASIQVILAEDAAEEAFQMSAEFAVVDEVFSDEEYEYWGQLAVDLELDGERATELFNEVLEEYEMDTYDSLF